MSKILSGRATVIPGATFIPESRVDKYFKSNTRKKLKSCTFLHSSLKYLVPARKML